MTPSSTMDGTAGTWAFFGATGVTGRMILSRALQRGHRPTLVGRDLTRLAALAAPHGLRAIAADLEDPSAVEAALMGHGLVFNAAGPFAYTAAPLIDAALALGINYIDVNGEIDPLEALFRRDDAAKAQGVALIGGAGFGIAAADGLAGLVADRLGGVDWLRLGVAADSAFGSPAVAESTIAVVAGGGREIVQGMVRSSRLAQHRWHETLPDGHKRAFASAPLAELAAVRHSLGVQTAIAGVPMPHAQARVMQLIAPLLPKLINIGPVRRQIANTGGHAGAEGASARSYHSRVWVEGRMGAQRAHGLLETGEGFAVAVSIAMAAVETMQTQPPAAGAHTPASAFGRDWITHVPGISVAIHQ